jgi:hypothetical protein
MPSYSALEPSSFSALGINTPSLSSSLSFYDVSVFIYTLFFVAIVAAAFYQYVLVGVYRMEASESGIRKSNETFKRVTLGLFGVFGLFLLLGTLNSGLLTGDISLSSVRADPVPAGQSVTTAVSNTSSGGSSRACESKEVTISKLTSSGGICGGATCTVLSGCNYSQYMTQINDATAGDELLKKMIIVTMCKESRGRADADNTNPNGTHDCGLMQINQPGACTSDILNPAENIRRGVALMKEKIRTSNMVYPTIPSETGPMSAYNCCANGTRPNDPSSDCTTANGFPFTIPKWACPINPGDGQFNMCTVKSYVCELSACMKQL